MEKDGKPNHQAGFLPDTLTSTLNNVGALRRAADEMDAPRAAVGLPKPPFRLILIKGGRP